MVFFFVLFFLAERRFQRAGNEPGKLGNSKPGPAAATGRHQIWKGSDGNGEENSGLAVFGANVWKDKCMEDECMEEMDERTKCMETKRGRGEGSSSSTIQGAPGVPCCHAHRPCHLLPAGQILPFPFPLPQTLSQPGQCPPFPAARSRSWSPPWGHREVQLGLSPLSHPCSSQKAIPTPGELRVSSECCMFIWTRSKAGNFSEEL